MDNSPEKAVEAGAFFYTRYKEHKKANLIQFILFIYSYQSKP